MVEEIKDDMRRERDHFYKKRVQNVVGKRDNCIYQVQDK